MEKKPITAIPVALEELKMIKINDLEVDRLENKIPRWHKEIIDARLNAIESNPERIRPISELMNELDK